MKYANTKKVQKIMAGQKKKLRYSEEAPRFHKYYIGWIGIGTFDHKTSSKMIVSPFLAKDDKI